jgi:hypothetical protein
MEKSFSLLNHPEIEALKHSLFNHSIYEQVDDLDSLCTFMEAHVFAVWDFMSLAKRLQRELTCISVPWLPPEDRRAARLINEMIVAEESDIGPDGLPLSHLELYLAAMEEVGADTRQFRRFIRLVGADLSIEEALSKSDVPPCVKTFVLNTLSVATRGQLEEVMAAFFFGREDIIPEMFRRLLSSLRKDLPVDHFVHYLNRHIELDSGEHGPAALEILMTRARGNAQAENLVIEAAKAAIRARINFFSQIELALRVPLRQGFSAIPLTLPKTAL